MVTGGTGFVGQRLVEMLVERGAERVVSFDIVPPQKDKFWQHPKIEYVVGDISDKAAVLRACAGADCVFHVAAIVGPFHPHDLYFRVNYEGTLNVLEACRAHRVPKLVMSSSPSTRFDGKDIDGLTEAEMPALPQRRYLQIYAETKAMGEMAVTKACSESLLTVAVAPHQVYGPRDNLFLPNVLEAAGNGHLRIFSCPATGYGRNRVCFTHVDNYCHGLLLGERALYPGSAALGKFYVVTDGDTHPFPAGYTHLWESLDQAGVAMGFDSVWSKLKLPTWLLYPVALVCELVSWALGLKLKLIRFNVRMMTMHRWFNIAAATRDLGYRPIVPFVGGWEDTQAWFRAHWLPKFHRSRGVAGIADQSQAKIDVQAASMRAGNAKSE